MDENLHKIEAWGKQHPVAIAVGVGAVGVLLYVKSHRSGSPPLQQPSPIGGIPVDNSPVPMPTGGGGNYGGYYPQNAGGYMPYYGTSPTIPGMLASYAGQSAGTLGAACGNFGKCQGIFGCIGNFFKQTATCGFRIVQTGALAAGAYYTAPGALGAQRGDSSPGGYTNVPFSGPFPLGTPPVQDYSSLPTYPGPSQPYVPGPPTADFGTIQDAVYHPSMQYAQASASRGGYALL